MAVCSEVPTLVISCQHININTNAKRDAKLTRTAGAISGDPNNIYSYQITEFRGRYLELGEKMQQRIAENYTARNFVIRDRHLISKDD
jgi:hypothetical protein